MALILLPTFVFGFLTGVGKALGRVAPLRRSAVDSSSAVAVSVASLVEMAAASERSASSATACKRNTWRHKKVLDARLDYRPNYSDFEANLPAARLGPLVRLRVPRSALLVVASIRICNRRSMSARSFAEPPR